MQTELSIEIDRPIAEVFDYLTNHVVEWSITVAELDVLEETPGVVGTTFRMVTEDRGRRMEFEGVVTRHDPPRKHAVVAEGSSFSIGAEYTFEELAPERTRVTQLATAEGKGFLKLFFLLFGWAMSRSSCKAQEAELASLKRLLEGGE